MAILKQVLEKLRENFEKCAKFIRIDNEILVKKYFLILFF